MKFNHLNVPDSWKHYWTRYPEGYTILEALISWVSQVDDMVDNVNNWNEYLDNFVGTFDKELQQTVTDTLSDWQTSGFLEVVISEALQWQLTDYIATNEADKISINQQLAQTETKINEIINKGNIILKVGDNEEFNTIGEALEKATEFFPRHYNDNAQNITILLTSGFIMKEQVFVEGLNLSHITLASEDEEVVISRQHITKGVGSNNLLRYPAFLFDKGSTSFIIDVLFNMDDTGNGEQRNGFYARNSSNIIFEPHAGCKNAGGRGLHLGLGSRGSAPQTIFTGAGNIAVRVGNNSSLQAEGVNVSGSNVGLGVSQSRADVVGGIFDDCILHGVSVNNQSTVVADNSSFIGSTLEVRGNSFGYFNNSIINSDKLITVYDASVLSLIDGDITARISAVASTFLGKRAEFKGEYEYSVTASDNSDVSMPSSTFNRVSLSGSSRLNVQFSTSTTVKTNFLEWVSGGNIINAVNATLPNTFPVNEVTSRGILFMTV